MSPDLRLLASVLDPGGLDRLKGSKRAAAMTQSAQATAMCDMSAVHVP